MRRRLLGSITRSHPSFSTFQRFQYSTVRGFHTLFGYRLEYYLTNANATHVVTQKPSSITRSEDSLQMLVSNLTVVHTLKIEFICIKEFGNVSINLIILISVNKCEVNNMACSFRHAIEIIYRAVIHPSYLLFDSSEARLCFCLSPAGELVTCG